MGSPTAGLPPLPFWGDGAPTRTQRLLHGLLSVGVQWGFARLRRHGLVHGWGGAEAVSQKKNRGVSGRGSCACYLVVGVSSMAARVVFIRTTKALVFYARRDGYHTVNMGAVRSSPRFCEGLYNKAFQVFGISSFSVVFPVVFGERWCYFSRARRSFSVILHCIQRVTFAYVNGSLFVVAVCCDPSIFYVSLYIFSF